MFRTRFKIRKKCEKINSVLHNCIIGRRTKSANPFLGTTLTKCHLTSGSRKLRWCLFQLRKTSHKKLWKNLLLCLSLFVFWVSHTHRKTGSVLTLNDNENKILSFFQGFIFGTFSKTCEKEYKIWSNLAYFKGFSSNLRPAKPLFLWATARGAFFL